MDSQHDGSVIAEDGRFFRVYRGERERDYGLHETGQNYQCDIVFPDATWIHRNPVVFQDSLNHAAR